MSALNISGVDYTDTNELFGLFGLYDCMEFFKSIGKNIASVKCASSARAIADMLYYNIFILKHYPDHIIFYDYDIMLRQADQMELNIFLR